MPSITFSIQYQKNNGSVLSATDLINLYFFGTPPVDSKGNRMSDETIQFFIDSAQKEIENYLNVKFVRTAYRENRDYLYDDWVQWNYIPVSYPVVKPLSLKGYANTTLQLEYPQSSLSYKKQSPDEDVFHRSISMVPASGSASIISTGIIGLAPYMGFFGSKIVPNYWEATYVTGYNNVPKDIVSAVGYLSAIPVFISLSDLVLGPGVSSKSIGIDGLSQSISSSGGGAYANRIKEYQKILVDSLPRLKSKYVGIVFGVM